MSNMYNVSVSGSIISFLSGSCLALGLNLLIINIDCVSNAKLYQLEDVKKVSAIAFIGGGLTSFGLYFVVPNTIRTLWI